MAGVPALSMAAIKDLPPPDRGQVFHHDPDSPGLAVRVSPTGAKIFYLYRKVAGRPVKVALGPFDPSLPASRELPLGVDPLIYVGNRPRLNLKMARALALAVASELSKGSNPATVKRAARKAREGELTLAAAFDRYERDHLLPEGKRSTTDLRHLFERYLGAIGADAKRRHGRKRTKSEHGVDWSKRKLSAITPSDVKSLQASLRTGHGIHTANRAFELLRALYRWAAKEGLYDGSSPCSGLSKYREEARERFIQGDEAPRFFAAVDALPAGPFRDFVRLTLYTGARRNNVLAMRWADLDLHNGIWIIPAAASKNKKPMTIPLTRRAVEILEERNQADPDATFVFPAKSASGHLTPPKKQWAALRAASGLADLHLHDLRRSLGSWAAMTGASLPIIGRALGHRSSGSTQVYARLQTDPVREALQRAQDALLQAGQKSGTEARHDDPGAKAGES